MNKKTAKHEKIVPTFLCFGLTSETDLSNLTLKMTVSTDTISMNWIENCDVDNNEGECIVISKKPKMSTAKKHRIRKIH